MNTLQVEAVSPTIASKEAMENSTFKDSGVDNVATRATFLCLFIFVGFSGNIFLVVCVAVSRYLRSNAINRYIVSLAGANLCDIVLNMSLTLGSTITQTWEFGPVVCQLNSFFLHLICICTILGLAGLTVDRYVAVKHSDNYTAIMTHRRTNMLIIYSWVQATAFCLPLAIGSIPSEPIAAAYLCSLSLNSSLLYHCLTSVLCYITPLGLIFVLYAFVIKIAYKEMKKLRAMRSQHHYTNKSATTERPKVWKHIESSKFVAVLIVLWCVLNLPYLVTFYIEQFRNNLILIGANIQLTDKGYPWQVETTFVWMRLSYPTVLPFITFIFQKEMWQKVKDVVLCRKNNAIFDSNKPQTEQSPHLDVKKTGMLKDNKDKPAEATTLTTISNFHVPVLFATASGLHIQTNDRHDDNVSETDTFRSITAPTIDSEGKVMRGRKCDVNDSHADLLYFGDDTSDYDSLEEIDPYSLSHPVTTKYQSKSETPSKMARRSISQPNVGGKKHTHEILEPRSLHAKSIDHHTGDSGIDICSSMLTARMNSQTLSQDTRKTCMTFSSSILVSENDIISVPDKNIDQNTLKSPSVENSDSFECSPRRGHGGKKKRNNVIVDQDIDNSIHKTKKSNRTSKPSCIENDVFIKENGDSRPDTNSPNASRCIKPSKEQSPSDLSTDDPDMQRSSKKPPVRLKPIVNSRTKPCDDSLIINSKSNNQHGEQQGTRKHKSHRRRRQNQNGSQTSLLGSCSSVELSSLRDTGNVSKPECGGAGSCDQVSSKQMGSQQELLSAKSTEAES